jgi:hypothetical protein
MATPATVNAYVRRAEAVIRRLEASAGAPSAAGSARSGGRVEPRRRRDQPGAVTSATDHRGGTSGPVAVAAATRATRRGRETFGAPSIAGCEARRGSSKAPSRGPPRGRARDKH